jgi:acetyl esterase/lipase
LAIYPITDPLGSFFTTPQPHPDGHLDRDVVSEFLDPNAEAMSGNPPESARGKMYYFMLQSANLADLLSVKENDTDLRIAKAIKARGGEGKELPPIYVVHGDADKFVGVEQSDEVVEAIRETGGKVMYERLEGKDHLFDKEEGVGMEGMYEFMGRYV